MTLLAFPSATVLVLIVSEFDDFKTAWTDKSPIAVFFYTHAKQYIIRLPTTATGFDAYSLDLNHRSRTSLAVIWLGSDAVHYPLRFGKISPRALSLDLAYAAATF